MLVQATKKGLNLGNAVPWVTQTVLINNWSPNQEEADSIQLREYVKYEHFHQFDRHGVIKTARSQFDPERQEFSFDLEYGVSFHLYTSCNWTDICPSWSWRLSISCLSARISCSISWSLLSTRADTFKRKKKKMQEIRVYLTTYWDNNRENGKEDMGQKEREMK